MNWVDLNWIELNWIAWIELNWVELYWIEFNSIELKASFSHLHLSLLEGCLARNAFLKVSGCTKCCVLLGNTCLGRWMGKLVRRTGAEHARLNRDHGRIGRAVELPVQASFSQLELAKFEGSLAQKLHFHIFHFFRFWRKPGTKALFSHLPLWDFEGSLARKPYSHIFHFQLLRDVSHESFVFTSSTFRCWGMSRTKASVSHLPLSFLEGTRTKASFSHLHLSLLEGCLARNAFLKVSGCTKCCVLQDRTCLGRWMGKLVRRTGAEHARLNRDHGRIGRTVELPTQASFCQRSCA